MGVCLEGQRISIAELPDKTFAQESMLPSFDIVQGNNLQRLPQPVGVCNYSAHKHNIAQGPCEEEDYI